MPWNDAWPDVTQSVKANGATGVQNSNFIDTSMKRDHFWNQEGANDGRHRQVQMIKTETGGSPDDIVLAGGINGGMYVKDNTDGVATGFYINDVNIYQFIPAFLTGSIALNNATQTVVVAVPDDTYGQIYMWVDTDLNNQQVGHFFANNGVVRAWSNASVRSGVSTITIRVKFDNAGGQGLNFRARIENGLSPSTYQYRITYWDI